MFVNRRGWLVVLQRDFLEAARRALARVRGIPIVAEIWDLEAEANGLGTTIDVGAVLQRLLCGLGRAHGDLLVFLCLCVFRRFFLGFRNGRDTVLALRRRRLVA